MIANCCGLKRQCIAKSVAFHLRDAVHIVNQLDVATALLDVTACKHPLLCVNHYFRRQARDLAEQPRIIYKAWNVAGYEAVHHTANADDLAGEDASIDSRLRIVPHDATQKLHIGRSLAEPIFHVDCAIGILQIAVASASTQIDPTAEIAVTEEAVVLFIAVGFDNGCFHFATNFGCVGKRHCVFDRRMFQNACPLCQCKSVLATKCTGRSVHRYR